MLIEILDTKHLAYDADHWACLDALYKGGKTFEAMIHRFLIQNPSEPGELYAQRKRESHYRSYIAPIVSFYAAFLFASGCNVKSKDENGNDIPADKFYGKFRDDVGGDQSLADFMRSRTIEAMVKQCSHWLIKFPRDSKVAPQAEMTKADVLNQGLGDARLVAVNREQLYDFECDEMGKLLWCVVHDIRTYRPSFDQMRNRVEETWTYYDRRMARRFVVEYEVGRRPTQGFNVEEVETWEHGALEVPLVTLGFDSGMWLGERLRSAQVEHFRLSAGLAWAIRRTCYAMPILKTMDGKTPTMGVGYWMQLATGDSFEWASPDGTPFQVIAQQVSEQRDEIYRTAHQMAQGMDNNAETVGRSADSKEIDEAATRIMLNAYGEVVSRSIEETFEILSDARGDIDVTWFVEGFSGYDTTTAGSLVANAMQSQVLGVPSKTFRREMKVKVANALMPDVDQETKAQIRREITEAIDQMADPSELEFDATHEVKKMAIDAKAKMEAAKIKQVAESDAAKIKVATVVANKPTPAPVAAPPEKK